MFNILVELDSARGLLSVREVSRLLGKSECSIYRMVRKHQIPSLVIGGTLSFDPSALAMWLSKKEPSLSKASRWLSTT
jgi:excisionase family DNA binding protein